MELRCFRLNKLSVDGILVIFLSQFTFVLRKHYGHISEVGITRGFI